MDDLLRRAGVAGGAEGRLVAIASDDQPGEGAAGLKGVAGVAARVDVGERGSCSGVLGELPSGAVLAKRPGGLCVGLNCM